MGIKKQHFCFQKINNTPSAIFGHRNSLEFWIFSITHSEILSTNSRWRSSQISHPEDRCECQNTNPRALYEV